MGLFIMPFCFDRPDIQIEMVKINSELLKIKKIKQSQKVVVQAKFQSNLRQNLAKNFAIDANRVEDYVCILIMLQSYS